MSNNELNSYYQEQNMDDIEERRKREMDLNACYSDPQFLTEALLDAHHELERLEKREEEHSQTVAELEHECTRLVEERIELLAAIDELSHHREIPTDSVILDTPTPEQPPAPLMTASARSSEAPISSVANVLANSSAAWNDYPPMQPVAVEQPLPSRVCVSAPQVQDLDEMMMWDEPPDTRDEHIALDLQPPWYKNPATLVLLAFVTMTSLAVIMGVKHLNRDISELPINTEMPNTYASPIAEQITDDT